MSSSERRATRQRHLVAVARDLIRECGDAGFSMALLAERAGVSAATPYNLLGSKSEILRRVAHEDFARFVARLSPHPGSPLDTLLFAADRLVDHYAADPRLHAGLFRAAGRAVLADASRAWWHALIDAAIAGGEIVGIVQYDRLTDAVLRMIEGVAHRWLDEAWPSGRLASEMRLSVRLVLASLIAPPRATAMIAEIAGLQAAIETGEGCGQTPTPTLPAPATAGTDRRTILAARAVIVIFRRFEQVARGADLTIPQFRFLLMLKRGPRRASDLAAFAGIGRSTASALIADMQRRGLVFRTPDIGDGRAADLRVTDAGLQRYAMLEARLARALETLLPDVDRDPILDAMARFSESIDRRSRERTAD